VVVSDVDEEALTTSDPWQTAEALSLAKARAVSTLRPEALVIGGDTVVGFAPAPGHWELLGKPRDGADAERMLRLLSGRDHIVVTGVSLVGPGQEETFSETTHVRFRPLIAAEIAAYIATGEPMDKAGAYAIQGGAASFVESVNGSWSNVVGLPVEALKEHLRDSF